MRTAVRFALVALVLTLVPAGMSLAEPNKERVIVVLEPGTPSVADVALDVARVTGGRVGQVYEHALKGFSMEVPAAAVAALSRNPNVAYVEPDVPVSIAQTGSQPIPTGVDRVEADLNPPAVPMDGIDIAIIDTGVYIGTNPDGTARSHLDLNLRFVTDCTNAMFYPLFGGCAYNGNHQDENGHGTHVAGIAAACDNDIGSLGTAPCATLWSVKVLGADGSGSLGSVLAGIDFVTANAASIEVANMSLTVQGFYQSLNDAITAGVNAGVVFVVAAGNSALDASGFSPASHPDVITVSALADFDGLPGGLGLPTCRPDVDDTLADFSNFGPLVDIAAPGVCIYSTHLNDGYATYSGTSMASPAVAGAVARYLAERSINPNSRADVLAVRNAIVGSAIDQANPDCGFGGDLDSSPEPLLFLNGPLFGGNGACGNGTPPPPPANNPPTAAFSSTCTDLSCTFTDTSTDSDGTVVAWFWTFGDGNTSAAQNPSHTYTTYGDHTVTLTVTDNDGDSSIAYSDTVTVSEPAPNTPPVASFTSSCVDLTCTFTNTSTDSDGSVVAWSWGFGDGSTSTVQNPSHTYTTYGDHTVTLTVTDDDGDSSAPSSDTITLVEPPPPGDSPITADLTIGFYWESPWATVSFYTLEPGSDFVPGAQVTGEWQYFDRRGRLKTKTVTGVSDGVGGITFTDRFSQGPPDAFCVLDIVKDGYVYEPTVPCGGIFNP